MGEAVEKLREALHPITAKPLDLGAWMQLIIAAVIELDDRTADLQFHDPEGTDEREPPTV